MTTPDTGGTERLPPRYGQNGAAFVIGATPAEQAAGAGAGATPPPGGTQTVAPQVAQAGTARATTAAAGSAAVVSYPMPQRAAVATAPPAPVAVVPEGPPPTGGTLYSSRRPDDDLGRSPIHRMHRLRIGSHVVVGTALSVLGVPSPGSGLILGADRDRQPVPIRLFRPEPTRIGLVGELWTAQVLAFRALALGARIVVVTAEPTAWNGFGRWATGREDRIAIVAGERPLALAATAHQPILLVYDLGVNGAAMPAPPGPWQTQVTVLRQLTPGGLPVIQGAHLVMLKRLSAGEAGLSAGPLRLSQDSVQLLQVMGDTMIALLGGGADRYVWLTLTPIEQQFAGRGGR